MAFHKMTNVVFLVLEDVFMLKPLATSVTNREQQAFFTFWVIINRCIVQIMAHKRWIIQILFLDIANYLVRRIEIIPTFIHFTTWPNNKTVVPINHAAFLQINMREEINRNAFFFNFSVKSIPVFIEQRFAQRDSSHAGCKMVVSRGNESPAKADRR